MSFWTAHLRVLEAARALVDCQHLEVAERTCKHCGAFTGRSGRWIRPVFAEALAAAVLAQAEGFRADGKRALVAIGKAWKAMHAGGAKPKA